jgi:hypothetical protein
LYLEFALNRFGFFICLAKLPVSVFMVVAKLALGSIMAFTKGFKFRVLLTQIG